MGRHAGGPFGGAVGFGILHSGGGAARRQVWRSRQSCASGLTTHEDPRHSLKRALGADGCLAAPTRLRVGGHTAKCAGTGCPGRGGLDSLPEGAPRSAPADALACRSTLQRRCGGGWRRTGLPRSGHTASSSSRCALTKGQRPWRPQTSHSDTGGFMNVDPAGIPYT